MKNTSGINKNQRQSAITLKWVTLDSAAGIRTSAAKVDSPFGFAQIRRYENTRDCEYLAYVGSVTLGNSVCDANFGGNLDGAIEFTQHPFRYIDPADYWNGSEIQRSAASQRRN